MKCYFLAAFIVGGTLFLEMRPHCGDRLWEPIQMSAMSGLLWPVLILHEPPASVRKCEWVTR
jgi:hypothetical protein